MSQWAEIRQLHLVEGVSKKELSRRFDLDIKTVRRAVTSATPPKRKPSRRPRVLDPWREEIVELLRLDPRTTAKRVGLELGERGRELKERALRKYVRELKRELFAPEVFVHRTQPPGDTLEGDFFESLATIAGRLCKARVFVGTLPTSNAYFAKAYPVERLETLLDGLNSSFAYIGGLTRRTVLDNTKLAVSKVLVGTEREESPAFSSWRGSLPMHVDFCAPASGWEKGSVERGARYVQGLFFHPPPSAATWDELNANLRAALDADLDRRTLPDGRTSRQALIAECEHLRPLPTSLPEAARVVTCVSDKYAIVTLDRTRYSVPSELVRRSLTAKLYWNRVEIFDGAERVATHARSFTEGGHVLDHRHILRVLERKHRAIPEATALLQLDLAPVFFELRTALRGKVRQPDREWVRVLLLHEEYAMEEIERAVSVALVQNSPSLATVRQLLRQGRGGDRCVEPVSIENDVLSSILVEVPELSGYDALVEVAR